MRAVNLLPKDASRRSSRKAPNTPVLVAVVGGAVVISALASAMVVTGNRADAKRQELDALRAELAAVPKPPPPASPIVQGLPKQRTARLAAVTTALSQRVAWDRILREFSLVLPNDVWLSTLSASTPGASPGGAGAAPTAAPEKGFTMTGHTYSHEAVARLLSRLSVVPHLTNVQLENSTLAEVAGRNVVEFAIGAELRDTGVGS